MKNLRQVWSALVLSAAAVTACAACAGDDTFGPPPSDGGTKDGASDGSAGADASGDATAGSDSGSRDATHDVGPGEAAADSPTDSSTDAGIATRLLLSYNATSTSELVAFDVVQKQVAGRLTYPGFIGTTSTQSPDPYLMEQANDVVAKLDRAEPWIVRSSWSV